MKNFVEVCVGLICLGFLWLFYEYFLCCNDCVVILCILCSKWLSELNSNLWNGSYVCYIFLDLCC